MTKAMILAAGQGTRVRPLTKTVPKPMIPILGKPLLEYLIEHLASHGIREIMINVAFNHHKIENYFGDGRRWGVEIGYSYEGGLEHGEIVPRPVGSAGGMRKIQDFSGFFDETTVVVCGDAIVDLDITAAVQEHHAKGALASVVTLQVAPDKVQEYGVVVSDADGKILYFQEKPAPQDAKSTMASTGIYIFEPAALALIPPARTFDIGGQLFPLLVSQGLPFYAQQHDFNWIDIGRITDYWSVLQRVLRGEVDRMHMPGKQVKPGVWVGLNASVPWDEVDISGPVYIGSGCRIEPGAVLRGPSWLGHGCQVRAGAVVERCILFEYTRISANQLFTNKVMSPDYCVDSEGYVSYKGDETCALHWGDARATN
ncbi:NDP-sugar synthase [Rhodoferax sp.]|uniref:NDP-sugar synthase n=1 Tax=Rhodoferax sp. TaxID=50421 RepID=UPI0026062685|nr:NDP-sugar synthase [Rhodoferax sp.]MDD3935976.1 NDP-sugar synthase [Rhodoferax sp.]